MIWAELVGAVESGEFFLQALQFGKIVEDDVGVAGIFLQEVLMVVLGAIKALERSHFGHNLIRENFLCVSVGHSNKRWPSDIENRCLDPDDLAAWDREPLRNTPLIAGRT